jgi:hypothetical protein
MFGEKCHFRHEFRQFSKLHKHFYLVHIKALPLFSQEILDESFKKDSDKEDNDNEDK